MMSKAHELQQALALAVRSPFLHPRVGLLRLFCQLPVCRASGAATGRI